jgi:hypothetical protein
MWNEGQHFGTVREKLDKFSTFRGFGSLGCFGGGFGYAGRCARDEPRFVRDRAGPGWAQRELGGRGAVLNPAHRIETRAGMYHAVVCSLPCFLCERV